MNPPHNPEHAPESPATSKLLVRSEVLSVIQFLMLAPDPSKQEKTKQLKRLQSLPERQTVLDILLKELLRAKDNQTVFIVSELLMELGSLEALKEPLWQLISQPEARDEIKDAANLILRQLGDDTDPEEYLDYLDDPSGLINRETERMLEVSAKNPEALIDFLDFIISLPTQEQAGLIASLQEDYNPEYLLNLYDAILWAELPSETQELQELIIRHMANIRHPRATHLLEKLSQFYPADCSLQKPIQLGLKQHKLAGLKASSATDAPELTQELTHVLLAQSTLAECFVTLPDGLGNQGMLISRHKQNGDVVMMSVALNDTVGILDCFGFYQLTSEDFRRIVDKFHEASTKIPVSGAFCKHKLLAAEKLNATYQHRIPYEYTAWKVLLGDVSPVTEEDALTHCRQWANPLWAELTQNLYEHPDMTAWFLEPEDHRAVERATQKAQSLFEAAITLQLRSNELVLQLDTVAETLMQELLASSWSAGYVYRLAETAELFNYQNLATFCGLAATEAMLLAPVLQQQPVTLQGFTRQFGRRCLEEYLLANISNFSATKASLPTTQALLEAVLSAWQVEPVQFDKAESQPH